MEESNNTWMRRRISHINGWKNFGRLTVTYKIDTVGVELSHRVAFVTNDVQHIANSNAANGG